MGAYDKVTNVDLAPPNYLNNMTVSDYIDQFHFMQDGVIHELLAIRVSFFINVMKRKLKRAAKMINRLKMKYLLCQMMKIIIMRRNRRL